jgi:predicted site-specific integrase-resolvase
MNQSNHGNLMHPKEVATLLGIQEKTLAQWRSNRMIDLPYCKIGSLVRYREEDINRFINDSVKAFPGETSAKEVS